MTVTIYHNPKCSTSRNTLALIRERGIEPTIIEYLKTPLTRGELQALIVKMGVPVRDVVRWSELRREARANPVDLREQRTPGAQATGEDTVAAAGITEDSGDDALLDAMVAHPILINRPIVVTEKGAKLCRPSETIVEIL